MKIFLLRLLISFCFDWEDVSNTADSVSSAILTPRISSKILRGASYFQLSSWCLDIPMYHCLECLYRLRFVSFNLELICTSEFFKKLKLHEPFLLYCITILALYLVQVSWSLYPLSNRERQQLNLYSTINYTEWTNWS